MLSAKARLTRTRWMDSAIFNPLPLMGVYSGMMPCAISQHTNATLLWPLRLSRISNNRKGGNNLQ